MKGFRSSLNSGLDGRVAAALRSPDIVLEDATVDDIPDCAAAYDGKVAHFVRPRDDWEAAFRSRRCMTCPIRIVTVRGGGPFAGYFLLAKAGSGDGHEVLEFAGDPSQLAGALDALMSLCGARTLKLRLQTGDQCLRALLERAGATFEPVAATGTILIVNFACLMARLRPFIEARAGLAAARNLAFKEEGGQFMFTAGADRLCLSKAETARMIFGHLGTPPPEGVWADVFPVPSLGYGLNYV